MNQLANAFVHTKSSDEMGAQRLDSKGQFAYFATPAHLWPDFLIGQIGQPLRVVLIEDETHLRGVVGNDFGRNSVKHA
jgi:hypothetical protein